MPAPTRLAALVLLTTLAACTHSSEETEYAPVNEARVPAVEFDLVSLTPETPDGRIVPGNLAVHTSGDILLAARVDGGTRAFEDEVPLESEYAALCVVSRVQTSGETLWTRGVPCPRNSFAPLVATDDKGRIYATVDARGSNPPAKLDDLPEPAPKSTQIRSSVHAMSADGEHLWSLALFGEEANDGRLYPRALETTTDGDLLVAGTFRGAVQLGDTRIESRAKLDAFLGRLSADGTLEWTRTVGSTGHDGFSAIGPTVDGGLVVGGRIGGTLTGAALESQPHEKSAFVARFGADGAPRWSAAWGHQHHGASIGALDVASDGRVAILGMATGEIDFGDGPMFRSRGSHRTFVGVLDANGSPSWVRGFDGDTNSAGDVLFEPDGSLRASVSVGQTTDNQVVDHVSYGDVKLENSSGTDTLVMRLEPGDGALLHQTRLDATADESQVHATHLVRDRAGAVIVVGRYEGAVDLGASGTPTTPGRAEEHCDSSYGRGVDGAHGFGCIDVARSATATFLMRMD